MNYQQALLRSSITFALLGMGACASNQASWEKRYDEMSQPIREEYQQKAEQITARVYNYRFSFVLEADRGLSQEFSLNTHFPSGIAELSSPDKLALAQKLDNYKGLPGLKIHIIGHTDSQPVVNPNAEYKNNQALSEARAANVAQYLRDYLDLADNAVTYEGQGENRPIANNDTASGRAQNRRVDIQNNYVENDKLTIASPENEPKLEPIPEDYEPWWRKIIVGQMNKDSTPLYMNLEDLRLKAIQHSTQIKVFSDLPLIRQTVIEESKGKFDPHVFVEAKYNNIDEPVGSELRTGGPSRYEEESTTLEVGIKKDMITGGQVELSQTIGRTNSNSLYFTPNDQADSVLALTFRQPLLNRFGIEYNESQIEIAKIDHNISIDEFQRQVASHLLEVERAYWALYLERANLLQKKKLYMEAERTVAQLEARKNLDVMSNQVALAKATLSARYANSIRAEQAVRNAEGKILSLINDPSLLMTDQFEIATVEPPKMLPNQTDMEGALKSALERRPEVNQAFKQLKAGLVREQMTENELRPVLDFIAEVSMMGLRGEYDYSGALKDEIDYGRPSYSLGLVFDYPLGNREAEARHRRRMVEVRQLGNQLRTTIETIMLEVQVAVRELNTSYREMLSQYHAMQASKQHITTLEDRRRASLSALGQGEFLRNLLDAQEDVANAEYGFLQAYIAYNAAHSNLDRAKGVFLEIRKIESREDEENGLPVLRLERVSEQ